MNSPPLDHEHPQLDQLLQSRNAYFLDLSDDLLNKIRHALPVGDLFSHLALRRTCSRMLKLYDCDDHFGEAICREWLLGRPRCVAHKSWIWVACTFAKHYTECMSTEGLCCYPCDTWSDFMAARKTSNKPREDSIPPAQLPFGLFDLNINISVDGTETEGRRWDAHGASWCRLAVIPPVDVLRVNILHTYCIVKNEDGVTVWDVLDACLDELGFLVGRALIFHAQGRCQFRMIYQLIDDLCSTEYNEYEMILKDILHDSHDLDESILWLARAAADFLDMKPSFAPMDIFDAILFYADPKGTDGTIPELLSKIRARFPVAQKSICYQIVRLYSSLRQFASLFYFQGLKNLRLEKYEDRVELTVDTDWDTYS